MGKAVGSGSVEAEAEAEAVAEDTANHADSDRFTGCQSGSRFGGIGRYSMSLAKAMLRLETNHEFYLLLNSRLPYENFIRAEFADLMPQQNILTFDIPA